MQAQLYEFLRTKPCIEQLIVLDPKEAFEAKSICEFVGIVPFVLPDIRLFGHDSLKSFRQEFFEFNHILHLYLKANTPKILITPLPTALLPFAGDDLRPTLRIEFAQTLDVEGFKVQLLSWGYHLLELVEMQAEASFRGDIIDLYPIGSEEPYRITLFDNEIDSIKHYDPNTQKSYGEELECLEVLPAYFGFDQAQLDTIKDRIQDHEEDREDLWLLEDTDSQEFAHNHALWFLQEWAYMGFDRFKTHVAYRQLFDDFEDLLQTEPVKTPVQSFRTLPVLPAPKHYKTLPTTKAYKELLDLHQDKDITLISANDALLKQYDLFDQKHRFTHFKSPAIVNLISHEALIVSVFNKTAFKPKKTSTLALDELKVGDFVVHHHYGIGLFQGIENTQVLGHYKDFASVLYQNEDKLLVPIENLHVLDRYVVDAGSTPALDRLGKGSFAKLKSKVKTKLLEIADKIIALASQREVIKATPISVDVPLIETFQGASGFEYTREQSQAVEDILSDFESQRVMDRLLVGDVGFGKTEVALNALFGAVMAGHQSLVVAPTTLLVHQHFKSIAKRLEPYGIKVAEVNRFISAKDKKKTFEAFENGNLKVVVGTHAVFGIKGQDLALVVVDEEHKFGVKQKEHLKDLSEKAHVLSMSATPIPRSLNLALSHIKTISYLTTPPVDRKPVRTYVRAYTTSLIKEVVGREKRRNGQIFYIHNSIKTIDEKAKILKEELPELRILVLHSKIPSVQMEKGMLAFELGKYDVLLCTSIIESGIHIPNANTIIIDGADRFGLADLHQLRGRVGRSAVEGFCYFLVEDIDEVSDDAKKRLSALEVHSALGSGSLIARQDLELRGAGNILGEVQSGHIHGVGYGLYVKMLEEALQTLSNAPKEQDQQIDIKLSVDKFISSDLISDDRLRLDIYRRLSHCKSLQEVYAIEEEITDRFGEMDNYTKWFLEIVGIKIMGLAKSIASISNYEKNITITYHDEQKQRLQAPSASNEDIIATISRHLKA